MWKYNCLLRATGTHCFVKKTVAILYIEECQQQGCGMIVIKEDLVTQHVWKPSLCRTSLRSYNPAISVCWKGCDYATGRMGDDKSIQEAKNMCKQYTAEMFQVHKGELQSLRDLRVHAEMFPSSAHNAYRACLAGVRRQRY